MRKGIFLILLMISILSVSAKWDMDWSDGNQLNLAITNYGILGHNVLLSVAGGYWPAGYTAEMYVYGSGLWFGALIDTSGLGNYDTLVTAGYAPGSGAGEFVPGDGDDEPSYTDPADMVYRSCDYNWQYSSAPLYKPDSIVSNLDTWGEFNDLDAAQHFTTENKPLGLLVRQTTYAFRGNYTENIVFIKVNIKNVNEQMRDWENCYMAYNIDADIGNESGSAANDLLGFIDTMTINSQKMRVGAGYVFQTVPEGGWVHTPGVFGCVFLETPPAGSNIDIYKDGSLIIPQGDPIGLTSVHSIAIDSDPADKEERYQLIAGYDHQTFNPSDPDASYDPFPNWGTGVSGFPGQSQDTSLGGDKRILLSCGPFDLNYGDSIDFVIAYFVSPDSSELLNHALYAKDLWNNSLSNKITLISPSDSSEISGTTGFSWNPYPAKDSFYIELSALNDSFIYTETGINTGNNSLNTSLLSDGPYNWYVTNYNDYTMESHSDMRLCLIDNPGVNCKPWISSADIDINNDRAYLSWNVLEPEDDSIRMNVTFVRNIYNDTVCSFSSYNSNYSFSAYNNLPDGTYRVIYDVMDDSSAVDTFYVENFEYESSRPSEPGIKISGDNDYVHIDVITYNTDYVKQHTYRLDFDFPYCIDPYAVINLPFTVTDIDESAIILTDTAIFNNPPTAISEQQYNTDIFDGIGLRLLFDSIITAQFDSVRVINDLGTAYPESLLKIETECSIMAGRDLDIYWHHNGDSIYAEIIPCFYSDSLNFVNPAFDYDYAYYFGLTSPYNYLNNSIQSRFGMYVAGLYIYFNKTARALPMDIAWYPDEGEVWRIYSTGKKIPIKGDSYMFSPSGIISREDIEPALFLSLNSSISTGMIQYSITGIGDVDLNLYDVTGRKVMNLFTGSINGMKALSNQLCLPSGIYFMKDINAQIISKKIILMK